MWVRLWRTWLIVDLLESVSLTMPLQGTVRTARPLSSGVKDFGPVKCASLSLRELHRASLKEFGPGVIRSAVKDEFHWAGVLDASERLMRYRRYVYEAGALNRPVKNQAKVIKDDTFESERHKNYQISRVNRFLYRTQYFTDSGIIGTKEFVSTNYQRFRDIFMSKQEKIPRVVAGLDGVYSLKRLVE